MKRSVRLIVDYFRGAFEEFRRVIWPTRQQVINYTLLVIATIVVGTSFLTAFQYGMQILVDKYIIR